MLLKHSQWDLKPRGGQNDVTETYPAGFWGYDLNIFTALSCRQTALFNRKLKLSYQSVLSSKPKTELFVIKVPIMSSVLQKQSLLSAAGS